MALKMIKKLGSKKSQAALEFIMTYGWAILVVLVAIGALAYFGVLSPDKFLPSKCFFPSGIACLDHKATATTLAVSVRNSLGYDITVDAVKAQQCTALGSQGTLSNGATTPTTYTLTCVNGASTKYNGNVNITYTNIDTQVQHTSQGQVTTRIE
ncbi:hypothetical protein HYS31_06435 [Candidatus Woesearchaeota archaeon]|nr:hypothetical protein [Candidatus Woesearchaeota archaeon]